MCKKENNEPVELLINNELPELIEQPFPYLVLGDLREVTKRLNIELPAETINRYQLALFEILYEASPEGTTYIPTITEPLIAKVEAGIIEEILDSGEDLGIVQLDRYIGADVDDERYFRLNLSRGINGGLMTRPGSKVTPDEQIRQLYEWAIKGNYRKLLLVDDVLAFGDTLVPLIKGIKEVLPEADIEVLVGVASSGGSWSGIEKVKEETGVEVRAMTVVKASSENDWTSGMALPTARDFTFLGGKILSDGETQLNFPYFLPFSIPVVSFMPKEVRFEISRKLMDLSIEIINAIDTSREKGITVGDLVKAGFGVPMSKMACLSSEMVMPDKETRLSDYMEYYRFLLESKQEEIKQEAGIGV